MSDSKRLTDRPQFLQDRNDGCVPASRESACGVDSKLARRHAAL